MPEDPIPPIVPVAPPVTPEPDNGHEVAVVGQIDTRVGGTTQTPPETEPGQTTPPAPPTGGGEGNDPPAVQEPGS